MPPGNPQPAQDPAPTRNERDLFLEALDHPDPAARAAFLDRACAGNPSLRAAVDSLLDCHRDDTFLASPLPPRPTPNPSLDPSASARTEPGAGDRIGRYKLLQPIGEGGAGTVFMAEQEEPVRRRVALKVIKPGMDTKSVIARFESERQALAMMDHPHIAKVLDAGTTTHGRPFFVMELVRGTRITSYCDENHVATRQRLKLFIQVCQAIQHAHQKGVIHRDIKPSNILVTLHDGVPVPKVIDFGIAKAIGQRLTDKTVFTEFQAFIGTPAYMSPEQAEMSGLDIDTRSDVYSLGVLLYEILTGRTPFDPTELVASGIEGLRRTLREKEPLAPSTRLRSLVEVERTTTAGRHRTEPARLVSLLSGDLDWIVLKALDKDRTRRYDTALDLAQDVQCYLDDEPVTARPPSALYRFRKLVRRNRLVFAAGGAFVFALLLGLALATWQFLEKSVALRHVETVQLEQRALLAQAQRARATEAELRRQAEEQELRARQRAYAADINLAQHALSMNNLGRARELLDRQVPSFGASDLRGWEWRYLARLCQSDALFGLPKQSSEIQALAVSSDGRWLAAATSQGDVVIFDIRSRAEVSRIPTGHSRLLVAFSPGTSLLAFNPVDPQINPNSNPNPGFGPAPGPGPGPGGGRRQRLRLWDPTERRFAGEFPLPANALNLTFSRDGTRIAVVCADGQCVIRNVIDGTDAISRSLPGLRSFPFFGCAALTDDLRLVAYTTTPNQLRVLNLQTGQILWNARAADEMLRAIAFSPDGSLLATSAGFVESAIRIWDLTHGTELTRLEGHRGWVGALAFWPDGIRLASASADQTVRLWDLTGVRSPNPEPNTPSSGTSASTESTALDGESTNPRELAVLRGHELEVWSLALAPSQDLLLSGSKDGVLFGWDITSSRQDRRFVTLPDPAQAWCFSSDSQAILTSDHRGTITRWTGDEFQDGTPIASLHGSFGVSHFSHDGRLALAADPPGRPVRIWDLQSAAPLATWHPGDLRLQPLGFGVLTNGRPCLFARRLADGSLEQWDLDHSQPVRSWPARITPPGPGPASRGIAFTPDGNWWFIDGEHGPATVLGPPENQPRSLDLASLGTHSAAFSPDGHRLAIIGRSASGELWDPAVPQRVASITGFLQGLSAVAFSPDGSRLVVASDGREAIKIHDAENNLELVTLSGPGSKFHSPTFSPDGSWLGARNGRGMVLLWRAFPVRPPTAPTPAFNP